MKRLAGIAAALLLLLAGCGQGAESSAQMATTGVPAATVGLVYSEKSGTVGSGAARLLGEQLSMNTGNAILLESRSSPSALEELRAGTVQLALVTSQELAAENHDLSLFTGPFLWKDYLNFSTTANSDDLREMVEVLLGPTLPVKVMGAFYGGGEDLLFRKEFLNDGDPSQFTVGIEASSSVGAALSSAGFVITAMDPVQIEEAFVAGELDAMEGSWDDGARLAPEMGEDITLFLLPTHHRVDGVWLLADQAWWNSLSLDLQVQIQDSVAAALEISDEAVLTRLEEEAHQGSEAGVVELSDRYRDLEDQWELYLEANYVNQQNRRILELCLAMRNS